MLSRENLAEAIGLYTPDLRRVLPRRAAQTTYDVLARTIYGGGYSDSTLVYGGPATSALLSLAAPNLKSAATVVEFGCGGGKLAARLLRDFLPPSCRCLGVDQSGSMLRSAQLRLSAFRDRALLRRLEDGDPSRFCKEQGDASVDVVV
jgi:SAM-dependent methyltransferase